MRSRMQGKAAQAAMVDAVLFMTLMLVASGVILGGSGLLRQDTQEFDALRQYTDDFAETVLAVELDGMWYSDGTGAVVELGGSRRSVAMLVCDEALLLRSYTGDLNFTGYEARITRACGSILRPGLEFAISCGGTPIFISSRIADASELPADRHASQTEIWVGDGTIMTVTVYVWVS